MLFVSTEEQNHTVEGLCQVPHTFHTLEKERSFTVEGGGGTPEEEATPSFALLPLLTFLKGDTPG